MQHNVTLLKIIKKKLLQQVGCKLCLNEFMQSLQWSVNH